MKNRLHLVGFGSNLSAVLAAEGIPVDILVGEETITVTDGLCEHVKIGIRVIGMLAIVRLLHAARGNRRDRNRRDITAIRENFLRIVCPV